MRLHRPRVNDDASSRVAAYESLLDLFTVISFILIFAAFIYVARAAGGAKDWASVSAQNAVSGAGVAQKLPNNVLLLIVYRENSTDRLTLIDGATGGSMEYDVTADRIESVLNSLSSTFVRSAKINIAVYEAKELANAGIVLAIQRWLPSHGYRNFELYFVGAQ